MKSFLIKKKTKFEKFLPRNKVNTELKSLVQFYFLKISVTGFAFLINVVS